MTDTKGVGGWVKFESHHYSQGFSDALTIITRQLCQGLSNTLEIKLDIYIH